MELARATQNPSSFTLCPPGVSRSPVSPRDVAMRSLLGLSIMPSAGVNSLTSVPCRQSHLDIQYHLWSQVRFGRQPPHSIQWVRSRRIDHPRANPGFGYSGSSFPPGYRLSSANPLYRKDFFLSTRSCRGQL